MNKFDTKNIVKYLTISSCLLSINHLCWASHEDHGWEIVGANELFIKNGQISQGNTPLHYAAESGNKEAAIALVASGAEIDARNQEGNTPAA